MNKKIMAILCGIVFMVFNSFGLDYFSVEIPDDGLYDYIAFEDDKDFYNYFDIGLEKLTGLSYHDVSNVIASSKKIKFRKKDDVVDSIKKIMIDNNYSYAVTYICADDDIWDFAIIKCLDDSFYMKLFEIDFEEKKYFDFYEEE